MILLPSEENFKEVWREFKDPEDFTGTEEEKLEIARKSRADIANKIN